MYMCMHVSVFFATMVWWNKINIEVHNNYDNDNNYIKKSNNNANNNYGPVFQRPRNFQPSHRICCFVQGKCLWEISGEVCGMTVGEGEL